MSGTPRDSAARASHRLSTRESSKPGSAPARQPVHPPATPGRRPPARCSPTSTGTAGSTSSRSAGTATSTSMTARGTELPGWPVKPEKPTAGSGLTVINDQKIDVPPALAQLDDDPEPELVIQLAVQRDTRCRAAGRRASGSASAPVSHLYAYNSDGTPVPGWPNSANALVMYYGSAQEFVTEGANAPVTADVDGDGKTEVEASAGIFSPSYLFAPNGSQMGVYGPVPDETLALFSGLAGGTLSAGEITDILGGDTPDDAPVNFATTGRLREDRPDRHALAGRAGQRRGERGHIPAAPRPRHPDQQLHARARRGHRGGASRFPAEAPGTRLPRGTGDRRRHRRRAVRRHPGRRQLGPARLHARAARRRPVPEVHDRLDRLRPLPSATSRATATTTSSRPRARAT